MSLHIYERAWDIYALDRTWRRGAWTCWTTVLCTFTADWTISWLRATDSCARVLHYLPRLPVARFPLPDAGNSAIPSTSKLVSRNISARFENISRVRKEYNCIILPSARLDWTFCSSSAISWIARRVARLFPPYSFLFLIFFSFFPYC